MQKTPEDTLRFDTQDCGPLNHILSIFLKTNEASLSGEDLDEIQRLHAASDDLTLMKPGDDHDTLNSRVLALSERPTVLSEGQTQIETSSVGLLTRIIGWASINLRKGTPTILTEGIPHIKYRNPERRATFRSADRAHNRKYVANLITAGTFARVWAKQLAPESIKTKKKS